MLFSNQVKEQEWTRNAFFELTKEVHGLDLAHWYNNGWWDDSYIPYTYFDGNKAVANASAFDLHFTINGEEKHYIQLSTVMTDPAYRNQGLASKLVTRIIADWKNRCDGIFLFSSVMARKLYASAGLSPKLESVWYGNASGDASRLRRLNLKESNDYAIFQRCRQKGNPLSAFSAVSDTALIMFYLDGFMADCVYYLEEVDTVLIVSDNQLYEVFGEAALPQILAALPAGEFVIGFTPVLQEGLVRKVENHDLFWYGDCPFDHQAACFPFFARA